MCVRKGGAGASGVVQHKFLNEGNLKYTSDANQAVSAMEQQVPSVHPRDACLSCIMTVDNNRRAPSR